MFACVCVCAYMLSMTYTDQCVCECVCLSSFNEAPQTGLIEPFVHHWTPHSSDAGQYVPPPGAAQGQTLLIRWQKQMHRFQIDQTWKTQSDEQWSQMVLKMVNMCGFVCTHLTVHHWRSRRVYVAIMRVAVHVTLCVCVCVCVCVRTRESCGVSKEFSVSEVSEPRLFDSTPLRLGEFPLQFPSAEPTLGKESHARKIYVDVSNENTTTPLPRLTIFVKQQSVHSCSLSLRSPLSPWIFPFLLMYVSEVLNPCWRGVSHFTWLVVSAGTLVT